MLFLMKKSAGPVKRLARARTIELNGPAERVELLLLIFMAPLWGIVFPLIGLSTLFHSYAGVILLGASFFCFLHFLHLNNSKFSFEEKGLRLPGVDHRLMPYTNLERIYLDKLSPLLLAVEFKPFWTPTSARSFFMPWILLKRAQEEEEPIVQLFEVQHLTEESARQMWSLFASHLRSTNISLDVRNRLVNWRTQGGKNEPIKLSAAPAIGITAAQAAPADHVSARQRANISVVGEMASTRSSEIARDLSMLVELKPFDPIKLIGQYMVSYSDTFRKTWLTCWTIVAGFAYPISIATMLASPLVDRGVLSTTQTQTATNVSQSFTDRFSTIGTDLTTMSKDSLMHLFGNHIGAIGLFILLYFAIYKFMSHLNDPDSMYIDYLGITTQKRRPDGVSPKEHRGWKSISAIHLLRPHEKSSSSRWSILFECLGDKQNIEIPYKAFSSDRLRMQFIECLDTWGRGIEIDPQLLEALSPRGQASYTELWLSALSEAPKIDTLTPHSVGLQLQERAYEIERQLASGGQGVAYLARKLKTREADAATQSTANSLPASQEKQSEEVQELALKEESEKAGPEDNEKGGGIQEKAEHTQPADRAQYEQVVLKETVMPIYVDEKARAKALSRFERDAKLLASLNHPLIVRLEDFFVENNRAYLALEYIHGKTLKDKVESEGPLPEEEVRRLALMMVDILEYLHKRTPPVVHRDFTPDNLMLTNDGKIKLIDFDVALEQSSFAQTNATIVGKQAYIPLEQFRGKPSSQSDIYALGASLSFLLTGEEPAALQSSHPREFCPGLSEELDSIIARATAVEVAGRYESAGALRNDLLGKQAGIDAAAQSAETREGGDPANGKVTKIVVASEDLETKNDLSQAGTDQGSGAGSDSGGGHCTTNGAPSNTNGNGKEAIDSKLAESIKLVVSVEATEDEAQDVAIAEGS